MKSVVTTQVGGSHGQPEQAMGVEDVREKGGVRMQGYRCKTSSTKEVTRKV
jgi:hypothetical protein